MASLSSYLPPEGSAVWTRDRSPDPAADSQTVRHVVIRSTEVVSEPSPHVVYRIDVLTEHSHWYICRRYSEFHDLHRKLVRRCKINKEMLPPKKISGNFSHQLIKQRKQQLEQYLQKLINSESHISQAPELLSFLDAPAHDVIRVAELLARQLYSIGDKLLEDGTPIALTINDLYCITKRLRLPMEPQESTDPSADLGHLYGFLHQIVSLKVILPPQPSSVTRMAFEITHFKSLETLKIEEIPLSQVSGVARVQQQLKKLSIHHSLKSLRELLVDSVEERRAGVDSKQFTESWRLVATAKFTSNRVVIQPWNNLVTLNISHNKITCLDDFLQVLPALKELNVSHNFLVHLDLQHLCLPFLALVNLSHNHITTVNSRSLVIESVTNLNLANNGIFDLSFLCAFVGVHTLNINNNRVSSKRELDFVSHLKSLKTIYLKGNPLMVTGAARIVLMAKFHLNSKLVAIDGAEPTNGELSRIRQQIKRYGTDIDTWPVARSLKVPNSPSSRKLSEVESPSSSTAPPSPPSVHVSWTIESLKKPFRSNDSPSHSSVDTSTNSEGSSSFDNPLFADSPINSPYNRPSKNSSLLISRDEPDGRSDISVDPPSDSVISTCTSSPLHLATPPCTPLSNDDDVPIKYSNVTPSTISAALEALSNNLSSTPSEESQLPCLLTQALNDFLSANSSKCATPPSTPQDLDDSTSTQQHAPISASELINAISSTLSAHCSGGDSIDNLSSTTMSSGVPSVPYGTPRDSVGSTGGLAELSRIGIQPESLLSALNKIRGNRNNDQWVELQSDSDDDGGVTTENDDIVGEMSMVDLIHTNTEEQGVEGVTLPTVGIGTEDQENEEEGVPPTMETNTENQDNKEEVKEGTPPTLGTSTEDQDNKEENALPTLGTNTEDQDNKEEGVPPTMETNAENQDNKEESTLPTLGTSTEDQDNKEESALPTLGTSTEDQDNKEESTLPTLGTNTEDQDNKEEGVPPTLGTNTEDQDNKEEVEEGAPPTIDVAAQDDIRSKVVDSYSPIPIEDDSSDEDDRVLLPVSMDTSSIAPQVQEHSSINDDNGPVNQVSTDNVIDYGQKHIEMNENGPTMKEEKKNEEGIGDDSNNHQSIKAEFIVDQQPHESVVIGDEEVYVGKEREKIGVDQDCTLPNNFDETSSSLCKLSVEDDTIIGHNDQVKESTDSSETSKRYRIVDISITST